MVAFCVLLVVFGMALSDGYVSDGNAAEQPGLTKIVVSELRSEFWLPVYLAHQLGYFKEEGLVVEFVTYKDGPIAFQGLHAGDSQFCMLSAEPVLKAYDMGKESKIILSTLRSKPYMFVAKKGIKDVRELKGKIIFAGMPGSAPYSFVQSILLHAGINPEKDVTWANMEYGASLGALEKGTVDAIYLRSTAKNEVKSIGANILIDVSDPKQHKKIYGTDKYESTIVTVTKDYAKKNPLIIQKFANSVVKAILWQSRASDELVAKTIAPLFEGAKFDAERISYLRPSLSTTGDISKEGYETIVKFCLETKLISKPIPYENIIDTSFIRKAHKDLSKK